MVKTSLSVQKLLHNLEYIVNLKISRAWKGYGSALFLELGELHEELAWKKGEKPTTSLTGEFTLSSAGAWKLLRKNGELFDAENASSDEIKKTIKELESFTIVSIDMTEKLIMTLSNNLILEFSKAKYGFFTLVSNEKSFISYEENAPYAHQALL